MADKPITFSGPMVRALLAGTKTQTRRFLSDTPRPYLGTSVDLNRIKYDFGGDLHITQRIAVGDRLYVREHWRTSALYDETAPRDLKPGAFLHFIADGEEDKRTGVGRNSLHTLGRFRQAMHMPKWASRITLHVTEVRVQRLQEISDSDSFAEGIPTDAPVAGFEIDIDGYWWAGAPRNRYRKVWEAINGPHSWDANPWVTATTFEVERCHIDQARAV